MIIPRELVENRFKKRNIKTGPKENVLTEKATFDTINEISSFEDVGLVDPFIMKESLVQVQHKIKAIEFETDIYPDNIMKPLKV